MRALAIVCVLANAALADAPVPADGEPTWTVRCHEEFERALRTMAQRSPIFEGVHVSVVHGETWIVAVDVNLGAGSRYLAEVHDDGDPELANPAWTRELAFDESGQPSRWLQRGRLIAVVALPWHLRPRTLAFDHLFRSAIDRCTRDVRARLH